MKREEIGRLIDRWIGDADFRKELRTDPEGTIYKCGITLDEKDYSALNKIDWTMSDETLSQRINKLFV